MYSIHEELDREGLKLYVFFTMDIFRNETNPN